MMSQQIEESEVIDTTNPVQEEQKETVKEDSLLGKFEQDVKSPEEIDQRFRPAQQQIDLVMDNCRLVIAGDTKMDEKQLISILYGFNNPKDLILLFLVNTCEQGLKMTEDTDEQKYTLYICCDYFKQLVMGDTRLFSISHDIFDCVLEPVLIWENHKFLRIWSDIIEYATIAIENRHNEENFPFCMSELAESIETK